MKPESLGLFRGKDKPDHIIAYDFYQKGLAYNERIDLPKTVKHNENFFIGKQWEGVESNGLPTPQINILKRVTQYVIAVITSDNIKVNASLMANLPGKSEQKLMTQVVNSEFDAIFERNKLPYMVKEFARNAAVDGDGCIHAYFDPTAETGQPVKGQIKHELIENTRVFFGNPADRTVQDQPYIIIGQRIPVRKVKLKAKNNKIKDWDTIQSEDEDDNHVDAAKWTDGNATLLTMYWKDDETGHVWCYQYTKQCSVREPWDTGLTLYPLVWLNWDYVADSYHGFGMITPLIPNQIFINKSYAMSMLAMMKDAGGKVIYDKTRIKQWDNRVGGAIGINGGDVNGVAKVLETPQMNPQVAQYIQLTTEETEKSQGATAVAMGDTRPDNTSAIVALTRAAQTPHDITKHNIYNAIEDLARIDLEMMGVNYGKRYVDRPATATERMLAEIAQQADPDIDIPAMVPDEFDFSILKDHAFMIKLDVGASSYYSEMAATKTLENLLMNNFITPVQFLERISDDNMPERIALIEDLKNAQEAVQMAQQAAPQQMPESGFVEDGSKMDVTGGSGYGGLQRAINQAGTTEGIA